MNSNFRNNLHSNNILQHGSTQQEFSQEQQSSNCLYHNSRVQSVPSLNFPYQNISQGQAAPLHYFPCHNISHGSTGILPDNNFSVPLSSLGYTQQRYQQLQLSPDDFLRPLNQQVQNSTPVYQSTPQGWSEYQQNYDHAPHYPSRLSQAFEYSCGQSHQYPNRLHRAHYQSLYQFGHCSQRSYFQWRGDYRRPLQRPDVDQPCINPQLLQIRQPYEQQPANSCQGPFGVPETPIENTQNELQSQQQQPRQDDTPIVISDDEGENKDETNCRGQYLTDLIEIGASDGVQVKPAWKLKPRKGMKWLKSQSSISLITALDPDKLPRNLSAQGREQELEELNEQQRVYAKQQFDQQQKEKEAARLAKKNGNKISKSPSSANKSKVPTPTPKVQSERTRKRKLDEARFAQKTPEATSKRARACEQGSSSNNNDSGSTSGVELSWQTPVTAEAVEKVSSRSPTPASSSLTATITTTTTTIKKSTEKRLAVVPCPASASAASSRPYAQAQAQVGQTKATAPESPTRAPTQVSVTLPDPKDVFELKLSENDELDTSGATLHNLEDAFLRELGEEDEASGTLSDLEDVFLRELGSEDEEDAPPAEEEDYYSDASAAFEAALENEKYLVVAETPEIEPQGSELYLDVDKAEEESEEESEEE